MRSLKGLKDRIELLEELSFYLRHREELLKEGLLEESDFMAAVEEIIREYAAHLLLEK